MTQLRRVEPVLPEKEPHHQPHPGHDCEKHQHLAVEHLAVVAHVHRALRIREEAVHGVRHVRHERLACGFQPGIEVAEEKG
jgi:hypothetical protein